MSVPILNIGQMREWEEATWASGQTPAAVMQRAGQAVARAAARLTREGDTVVVLAGRGHNGDDARIAAQHLKTRDVRVVNVTEATKQYTPVQEAIASRPALIIDGLFGIGLTRPLEGAWVEVIRMINESGARVLAVDVPSGLNADTGHPFPEAVWAMQTVTFGAPKRGMLHPWAWPFVGRLEVVTDLGFTPCPFEADLHWSLGQDFRRLPPGRPAAGHKGTFGHVVIIAGSPGYHGAAVLAARGAQRAQPGLVTVLAHESVYTPIASQLQAPMVRSWDGQIDLPETCTALLIGPGLASPDLPNSVQQAVRRFWRDLPLAVVVDASALDWLQEGPCSSRLRVVTPHPGEAARMLDVASALVQRDRPSTVRDLSRRLGGACIVLKGHQTIVGRYEDELFFNGTGNPHLAQGGSGDVLAGYLAGLLAQPTLQADLVLTARYAVWQHGAAADELTARQRNWTVEDLAVSIGSAGEGMQN